MVIITGVVSVTDLVVRAATFLADLPERWYKGDSQIKSFKANVKVLSQKRAQWERQLEQYGMSEYPALEDLLAETGKLLDAEEDKFEKHKNDHFWMFKKRMFPSKLAHRLENLREVVEGGPQILASSVEQNELLTKRFLTEPLPLPFGNDPKYVPLQEMVGEVQSALEDKGGPQVVVLYGEPGVGKSSLAKHVALLYQDLICGSKSCMFDGVQYVYCGQGCSADIRRLQRAILSNLGLGGIADAIDEKQGENRSLSSYQSALRRLLGNRRVLIVLDDVWREDIEVLTTLISREIPSRYLMTSQTRNVWLDARQIKMPKPTSAEALSILKSHTQGFPTDKQLRLLPKDFEGKIHEIISKVERHPLSLVNVAVSMNPSGAKDLSWWKALAQNIFHFLDENRYSSHILVNERPYSLSVSVSMMLMVESLPTTAERDLLFLIVMLEEDRSGRGVPSQLVRFFLRRCYHGNSSQFTFEYFSALQYLEDNSLVQVYRSERDPDSKEDLAYINSEGLTVHSLRKQYIRQKHLPALQKLASSLLPGHGGRHDGCLLDFPDSEQSLAVALGTAYFDESLMAEVAVPFQNMMLFMNNGEIPRNLEVQIDVGELVKTARTRARRDQFSELILNKIVLLLDLEGDFEELLGWKQQAHSDASKMAMKLVCKGEIDDESMASLLAIPHVRGPSWNILWFSLCRCREDLIHSCFFGERKSFSDIYRATGKAFSSILNNSSTFLSKNGWILSQYITRILEFESEITIWTEIEKWRKFASQSQDPAWQDLVDFTFLGLHKSRVTSEMLNGLELQQYLPAILWKAIDEFDPLQPVSTNLPGIFYDTFQTAMGCLCRDKGYVNIILTLPITVEEWLTNISYFRRLLQVEQKYGPESLLGVLSATQEFKARAAEILKRDWWEEDFTLWPESHSPNLARFWGNVALLRHLHNTTRLRLVKIAERKMAKLHEYCNSEFLCSCTCCDSDKWCSCCQNVERCKSRSWSKKSCNCNREWMMSYNLIKEVTRTMTIISHLHSNRLVVPTIECIQQCWVTSKCRTCRAKAWFFHVQVCMGRTVAFYQMEMYTEAISFATLALQACDEERWADNTSLVQSNARALIIFMKALSKDYQGAMESLDKVADYLPGKEDDFWQFRLHADRAVLFRLSGEFSKALLNFNISLEHWERLMFRESNGLYLYEDMDLRVLNALRYWVLQHRGYAKYLMGDLDGSRLDMKSAEDIRLSKLIVEPIIWDYGSYRSLYIGHSVDKDFVGLDYSLLHFPIDDQLL